MLASGKCCSAVDASVSTTCAVQCQTLFVVCLDDLHLSEPHCLFGEAHSIAFKTSNLSFTNTDTNRQIKIVSPSSWPVSKVWHSLPSILLVFVFLLFLICDEWRQRYLLS